MHARQLGSCNETKSTHVVCAQSGYRLLDDLPVEQVLVAGNCVTLLSGPSSGRAVDNDAIAVKASRTRICRRSDPACY